QAGDGNIYILSAESGAVLYQFAGARKPVTALAFSPDGKRLAVAAGKGKQADGVAVWDARGKLYFRLAAGQDSVHSLAFSPDGKLLATGTDRTIRLWDATTGKELATLQGHRAPVVVLIFAGDGRLLISGGRDGAVHLWEA